MSFTIPDHPWQLTKEQWNHLRESIRPNVAQSRPSKSDSATAIRRAKELEWLLFGIVSPERPVRWEDVIEKAQREGRI